MKYLLRFLAVRLHARRAPRLALGDVARTPMRVNLGDLDVMRHMNNGVYLTIQDLGRYDWMLRTGIEAPLRRRGWSPVVAAQTITYRRSLHLGERFDIETRLLGADERAFFLEQRFVVDGEIRSRAIILGLFVSKGGRVPMAQVQREVRGFDELPDRVPSWAREWALASRLPASRAEAPSGWDGAVAR